MPRLRSRKGTHGGHKEGHASRSTHGRTRPAQRDMSRKRHGSLIPTYFDNFLISWVAYIHIRTGFDLDWQAAYAASWIMRYMLSIVIIVITMTRTFPSAKLQNVGLHRSCLLSVATTNSYCLARPPRNLGSPIRSLNSAWWPSRRCFA